MKRLILASASVARTRLLTSAGVDHEVDPALVDETGIKEALIFAGKDSQVIAEVLASAKALAVSQKNPHSLVLGCDQVLSFAGKSVDKSPTMAAARDLLVRMRGKPHHLHSAAVLAENGRELWRCRQDIRLKMREFSDAFLETYFQAEGETILACVGGYRLEGMGSQLFESVEGDYFSVLGLPLIPLLAALRSLGVVGT
jgi:septum formation protein